MSAFIGKAGDNGFAVVLLVVLCILAVFVTIVICICCLPIRRGSRNKIIAIRACAPSIVPIIVIESPSESPDYNLFSIAKPP